MAAPLNTCTTVEQRGVVRFLWEKNMEAKAKKCCPYVQHFFVDILCFLDIEDSDKTK
jgi:hypothetical protein